MTIVAWTPVREFEGLPAHLNRIFNERPFGAFANEDLLAGAWTPAVDIQETENEYRIKVDLPEVKKEDVKVMYDNSVLTIEGERKRDDEETGRTFYQSEWNYGTFARCFALPTEIDGTRVSADFKDGVLNVHILKPQDKVPIFVKVT
jgi:HSP20 family protein